MNQVKLYKRNKNLLRKILFQEIVHYEKGILNVMTVKKEVILKQSHHKLSEIDKFQNLSLIILMRHTVHDNVCTKRYVSFHGEQLHSLFINMSLFV